VLRILEIAESSYYYHQKESIAPVQKGIGHCGRPIKGYSFDTSCKKISDEQIKDWLMEMILGEEDNYGYRKLTKALWRQHQLVINKKKTYRLCKELGILKKQRQRKLHHPRRLARNRTVTGPNQLWETDIKYGYIAGEDRFFYFMGVIDVYDREIIDYHLGLNCEGKHAAHILERALWRRKLTATTTRPVVRTDNGPQFISHAFEDACIALQIEHERIPPKTPNLNAHIESFHSILERDCYSRHEFVSYSEAYETVAQFIDFYNHRFLHGSLGDIPPSEFHNMVLQTNGQPFVVTL
jgi:putative transposase